MGLMLGLFSLVPSPPLTWCGGGVIAVVSTVSVRRRLYCSCWCGCRSYCSPGHGNIVSVLKIFLGLTGRRRRSCRRLGPALVVAVVPDVAVFREPLVSSLFPFRFVCVVCL